MINYDHDHLVVDSSLYTVLCNVSDEDYISFIPSVISNIDFSIFLMKTTAVSLRLSCKYIENNQNGE